MSYLQRFSRLRGNLRLGLSSKFWRRLLLRLGLVSLVVVPLAAAVLVASGTTYLQVEARSGTVEFEFSPGLPITWSLHKAQLLECDALPIREAASAAPASSPAPVEPKGPQVLDEPQLLEFTARYVAKYDRLDSVHATVLSVDDSVVIELRRLQRVAGAVVPSGDACDPVPSAAVILDNGEGKREGLRLPAQLRLPAKSVGDGLTLEFRGNLRAGREVVSSRQPLLTSGRLVMREVRAPFVQPLAQNPQFEIEARDLGLGDLLILRALDDAGAMSTSRADAPQGFLRIVQTERGLDMSVSATAQAARAEIIRPFSRPEVPQANLLKVAARDDLVQLLLGLLATLWSLGTAVHGLLPKDGDASRES